MTTTLTSGATTITPDLVNGFGSSRDSRTIVHRIIGTADPAVTLSPAARREGSLQLVFTSFAAAIAAETVLKAGTVWTLSDTNYAGIAMTLVISERIELSQNDERNLATLTIGYQEVAP